MGLIKGAVAHGKKIGRFWWENPGQIRFKLKRKNSFLFRLSHGWVLFGDKSPISGHHSVLWCLRYCGKRDFRGKRIKCWFSKISSNFTFNKFNEDYWLDVWLWLNNIFLWFFSYEQTHEPENNVLVRSHTLICGTDYIDIVAEAPPLSLGDGILSESRQTLDLKYLPLPLT